LVTYGGLGAGTFTSVTRTPTLAYAHGDGAPVYDVDTRDSPETLSSIGAYGIHSKSLQATSLSSKNDMDIQAERIISNYKDPVQRIVVNASDPLDFLETEDVILGDTITINNSSLENISDGDYRTIGFDLKYDGGWPTLTVYCINDDMRVQDLSDYLLHTEKLMNKVDADRQSANYLGGQNSNPIYSSGDNLILDPPGQVILSSLTVYGSSSDESVNIVTPAWINFENSDGDTTLANFGTDSFQIDGSLGGDINLVAAKNFLVDSTNIDIDLDGDIDCTDIRCSNIDASGDIDCDDISCDDIECTGDILLDDDSGDSPKVKFQSEDSSDGEVYLSNGGAFNINALDGALYLNGEGNVYLGIGSNDVVEVLTDDHGTVLTLTDEGDLDIDGCYTSGCCESYDFDCLPILEDFYPSKDGTITKYGMKHLDFEYMYSKYPWIILKKIKKVKARKADGAQIESVKDKYVERTSARVDVNSKCILELLEKIRVLEKKLGEL